MTSMSIELIEESAVALEEMAKITGRSISEVPSDALRTYLWILHQQTFGKKVVSVGEGEEQPMKDLVADKVAARRYFDELGW